jgi:hypothetical protein
MVMAKLSTEIIKRLKNQYVRVTLLHYLICNVSPKRGANTEYPFSLR